MLKYSFYILAILSFFTTSIIGQIKEYKTHLFLGTWIMKTDKDVTTEKWVMSDIGEMKGITIYECGSGSILSETMRLIDINGNLNFCATVLEQDPENYHGEVCFTLKSNKDKVFLFENLNHDFPKRIIYDFSGYNFLIARVEGDTNAFILKYDRYYDPVESFTLKGKIISEPFVNKAGRILENVFDYFYVIQEEKYFIKISDCNISKEVIDKNIGQELYCTIVFHNGLWDSDDNTHQSRIGNFITISNIKD